MLNVVIFGPPGVGKGTQSNLLIEKYNLTHICTGDILRYERAKETELGLIAKDYHEKGNLVPSDIINKIMGNVITEKRNLSGFIIDGYPRRIDQAVALNQILDTLDETVTIVIALHAEDDELRKRILERGKTSGRPDDQDIDIINTRIAVYKKETEPILNFYESTGKVRRINGTDTIENIFASICEHIESISVPAYE